MTLSLEVHPNTRFDSLVSYTPNPQDNTRGIGVLCNKGENFPFAIHKNHMKIAFESGNNLRWLKLMGLVNQLTKGDK